MPANCAPGPRSATVDEPDLLLDTDILIGVLRGNPQAGRWLESLGDQRVGISVLTWMEIL